MFPLATAVIPSASAAPLSRRLFRRRVGVGTREGEGVEEGEGTADVVPLQTHASRLSLSVSPSSESRANATCPPPLVPIASQALDPKPPPCLSFSLLSVIHPLTYPDPVARRAAGHPTPLHPRGAARRPRALPSHRHHARVHARSVCRQPAYQSCRSAHVTKFLLLLLPITIFTCLDTWPVVCSFSFRLYIYIRCAFIIFDTAPELRPYCSSGALALLVEEIIIAAVAHVRARA